MASRQVLRPQCLAFSLTFQQRSQLVHRTLPISSLSLRPHGNTHPSLIPYEILWSHTPVHQMEDIENEDIVLIDLGLFRQRSESQKELEIGQFM